MITHCAPVVPQRRSGNLGRGRSTVCLCGGGMRRTQHEEADRSMQAATCTAPAVNLSRRILTRKASALGRELISALPLARHGLCARGTHGSAATCHTLGRSEQVRCHTTRFPPHFYWHRRRGIVARKRWSLACFGSRVRTPS